MIIASWNVNSIKQRCGHVKAWISDNKPDILMIQELKGVEFPDQEFTDIGYQSAFVSQKANNGVAILSHHDIDVVKDFLPGDDNDTQARYIEADIQGIRVINIYAPNGNPVDTPKYPYKLAWMDRLEKRVSCLIQQERPFLIGGDFNVIPDDRDCYSPQDWKQDALFQLQTRQAYRRLIHLGLVDAFRVFNGQEEQYTFWDYQRGAWPQNKGIRIDHFLVSPIYADCLTRCWIDKSPRGLEKPSDHTVIACELDKNMIHSRQKAA